MSESALTKKAEMVTADVIKRVAADELVRRLGHYKIRLGGSSWSDWHFVCVMLGAAMAVGTLLAWLAGVEPATPYALASMTAIGLVMMVLPRAIFMWTTRLGVRHKWWNYELYLTDKHPKTCSSWPVFVLKFKGDKVFGQSGDVIVFTCDYANPKFFDLVPKHMADFFLKKREVSHYNHPKTVNLELKTPTS